MTSARNSRISRTIHLLIIIFSLSLPAHAKYSGGTGEPNDPYQIATAEDFTLLSESPDDYDKNFILTADIDLQDISLSPVGISGVFDGNNHIIQNAVIDMPESYDVGLFGYVDRNGQIRNLGVVNVTITGRKFVGGLVGYNSGRLTDCYVIGSVSGRENVGGLVGENDRGIITSCYANVSIVNGWWRIGGLVGYNDDGVLTACYATGSVSGYMYVGGLLGQNSWGELTACYAIGTVDGDFDVGGLVGENYGSITGCFWDIETSNQMGSGGGKGLTTNQMKSMVIYQNAGWAGKDWVINDGRDYPRLVWENIDGIPIPDPEPVPLLGKGTIDDPYQIWTAADFAFLSWRVSILDKHITLMADLDISDIKLYPIGDLGPFSGFFEGNNHVIHNAVIQQPDSDYVGLFGYVVQNSQIHNIGLENVEISGKNYVGALVGRNYKGILNNCYVKGSINGELWVGGLTGSNYKGTINACYANGSVTGVKANIGGLVGYNKEGELTNCYVNSWVIGFGYCVGGLIGWNSNGNISTCYATGSVRGQDHGIGGLIGSNGGIVTSCYATSEVVGTGRDVGGLVGSNSDELISCYATGSVEGDNNVGGLVGSNSRFGIINTCYANGLVTAEENEVGGLVGINFESGIVLTCFWDIDTSGQTGSSGGKGLTTRQMKSLDIYRNADWVGFGWVINDGQDYPRLAWENAIGVTIPEPEPVPLLGRGTEEDPYQIWTAADFALLSWHFSILDKHITLMSDLDLSGIKLYPIGDLASFIGVFDGKYHVISNAVINMPNSDYVGLFGYVSHDGQIYKLGVKDTIITGDDFVGGLIGYYIGYDTLVYDEYGCIRGCYVTGSVSGSGDFVGGLIGRSEYSNIIACHVNGSVSGMGESVGGIVGLNLYGNLSVCYTTGSVTGGNDYVGGLVGSNDGYESWSDIGAIFGCFATNSIIGNGNCVGGLVGDNDDGYLNYCYATGSVTGEGRVGGLVGDSDGNIAFCYSTGLVNGEGDVGGLVGLNGGDVNHSFWDTDKSGQNQSEGGVGLATAEMMDSEFVGLNGWAGDPNWILDSGHDYPHLAWEGTPGQPIPEPIIDWMDGMGISDNPYEVVNAGQLVMISKASIVWDKHFVLSNDISLIGKTWPMAVIHKFSGIFDGNGFSISNLTIVGRNKLGLFGRIRESAQVLNLGIVDANITGTGSNIGILAWHNKGNVTNCHSTGSVRGERYLGGLISQNNGDVIDSYSTIYISGTVYVGGLVGCNSGSITTSCSTGSVNANRYAGGLVGEIFLRGNVTNCYSTAAVRGGDDVGGLVGHKSGSIAMSYSAGPVTGDEDVGGLVGYNWGDVIQCFWDIQTSGQTISGGGTGLSTAVMQTADTFLEAGWDFVDENENGTDDIWWIDEGNDYPHLWWETE